MGKGYEHLCHILKEYPATRDAIARKRDERVVAEYTARIRRLEEGIRTIRARTPPSIPRAAYRSASTLERELLWSDDEARVVADEVRNECDMSLARTRVWGALRALQGASGVLFT